MAVELLAPTTGFAWRAFPTELPQGNPLGGLDKRVRPAENHTRTGAGLIDQAPAELADHQHLFAVGVVNEHGAVVAQGPGTDHPTLPDGMELLPTVCPRKLHRPNVAGPPLV